MAMEQVSLYMHFYVFSKTLLQVPREVSHKLHSCYGRESQLDHISDGSFLKSLWGQVRVQSLNLSWIIPFLFPRHYSL